VIVAEAQSEAKRKQSHGKYVLLGITTSLTLLAMTVKKYQVILETNY